jgi:hypothetical protein
VVTKPMQGDGPRSEDIYEYEPPVTLGELVATCEDDHNLMLALAMARAWPEGVPESDLEPWQRIGPDVLWMVHRQDWSKRVKIHAEAVAYVCALRWFVRKRLGRMQAERAVTDALDRLVTGESYPADIAAMSVACRKETYLELRAEALAFLINCMSVAQFGVEIALGMRPEPRTPA